MAVSLPSLEKCCWRGQSLLCWSVGTKELSEHPQPHPEQEQGHSAEGQTDRQTDRWLSAPRGIYLMGNSPEF